MLSSFSKALSQGKSSISFYFIFFFFQAEDGIRDPLVTGVQTCALPISIKYLFEKYPNSTPGEITDLKGASVNNQILGAICERIDLQKHIIHFSPKLMSAITNFIDAVGRMREEGSAVGEYWSDLDVPKVMSDVVESMLGAIFVDSGFDTATAQKAFDKWVKPVLDEYVNPATLKVHPVSKLTEYMQKNRCTMMLLKYVIFSAFVFLI